MRPIILPVILGAALLLAACLPTFTPAPTNSPISATIPGASATPMPALANTPTPRSEQLGGRSFKQYAAPPAVTIDAEANYTAAIRTNEGIMVIELFPFAAPKTVNNFVFLAREGFYDGIIFHRVIPGFMIQGGDPTGTGTAGPGYKFEDEIEPSLGFDRPGILAMANAGPNTNGSQFFITVVPTPHLNGAHTIFGQILEGQEVADAISKVEAGAGNRPVQPVIIQSIEITKSGGP